MALEEIFICPMLIFLELRFTHKNYIMNLAMHLKLQLGFPPGMTKAHNYLLDIYTSHLPNDEKRDYHKEFLDKNIKGERIIITGLIGSGTDLLVSFIQSLGLDIQLKKQTKKNQRNYILDEVKNLNQDKSFLFDLKKLIYVNPQYLSFLPSDYNYKVLWVQQDLDEVLKSDYKILDKKLPNDTIPIKQLNAMKKIKKRYLIGLRLIL